MNKNVKICFMGTPEFGRIVLERLIEEFEVVLVVTQPDKKGKRGNDLVISPVKKLALSQSIKVFQPENIKEDSSEMKNVYFDFLVTASYGQFIPLEVLHLPKFLTLNVHGSLLPKYRGGAPIQRAIENGEEYLGVTIMRTILKMDAGVMFKQSLVKLEETDSFGSMVEKLALKGREDLVEVINKFYDKKEVEEFHQDFKEVSFAPNITKDEEILDFNLEATKLFNKIRAFNPNPLCYFTYKGTNYKVYESRVVEKGSNEIPGTIISINKDLVIKCKDKALSITKIQSPGKKALFIKDFLNGNSNEFELNSQI